MADAVPNPICSIAKKIERPKLTEAKSATRLATMTTNDATESATATLNSLLNAFGGGI